MASYKIQMRDKDGNRQYPVTLTSSIIDTEGRDVEARLSKIENATYKNKGYYMTVEALRVAYPSAENGSQAFVGLNYPYAVYQWTGGAWTATGATGGNQDFSLENYYTKAQVNALFAAKFEILTHAEYDALPVKDADKLYFCTEE